MMLGQVKSRHALMPIIFCLPGQPNFSIDCVVDTGFTEEITLPVAGVATMQLPYLYPLDANLADDSTILIGVYEAVIFWNGVKRTVRVLAMGKHPLLGMTLFDGFELNMHVTENGPVTAKELPGP